MQIYKGLRMRVGECGTSLFRSFVRKTPIYLLSLNTSNGFMEIRTWQHCQVVVAIRQGFRHTSNIGQKKPIVLFGYKNVSQNVVRRKKRKSIKKSQSLNLVIIWGPVDYATTPIYPQFCRQSYTSKLFWTHSIWDDSDIAYSPIYCNSAHHIVRVCSNLYEWSSKKPQCEDAGVTHFTLLV